MEKNRKRSEWAGCSDYQERKEQLSKAHEEFLKMLEDGWQVKETKVKRPRIKKIQPRQPKYVITIVFGKEVKMTIEDFTNKCHGFKKVREIY